MVKRSATFVCLALGLLACGRPAEEASSPSQAAPLVRLERVWTAAGLANPESAALSADGTFLYVSNVAGEGEAKDGNGFIARVGIDGRVLQREWITGLDAPKGVARAGDTLYVSDIDRLVVIDIPSARVASRIAAPGARFLNDVAVAPGGRVLATDSETARIYALDGGALSVWLENPLLASANGLMPEADKLYVTTMQGRLLAIDYDTRAIETLAEGLGDADGIARLGEDFLISEWPGVLYLVRPDGTKETLLNTRAENIYLNDILLVGDTLYTPNWEPGSLTAFRVSR